MSPYFLCFDCSHVDPVDDDADYCRHCNSKRGRVITDEEFNEQYSKGRFKAIDPSTGKVMK